MTKKERLKKIEELIEGLDEYLDNEEDTYAIYHSLHHRGMIEVVRAKLDCMRGYATGDCEE